MKTILRILRIAAAVLGMSLAASCYPFIGALPAGAADGPTIQHVPYSGSFNYTVDTGTASRDVYFVFTNPDRSTDLSASPSVVSGSITVDGKGLPGPGSQALPSFASTPRTLSQRIAEFNRDPRAYLPQTSITGPSAQTVSPAGADKVDNTGTFWAADPSNTNNLISVSATCRQVIGPVTFGDGRKRTLSVWVDNSVWNVDVGQTEVDALAAKFLQGPTESQSDIYHWDTAVVGEPWGAQSYSDLITWDANSTVTILLSKLNTTYSGAVTVGYFWAKDNFTAAALPGSNERIMFYIDSKLYGKTFQSGETGWDVTNYWPKLVFSTLAHEFQHMIQFYQKQVIQGALKGTDTWINEMCSMIMEDLVADKQNVEGPRGVPLLSATTSDPSAGPPGNTKGRIPAFNSNSSLALIQPTTFDLNDYSVAYAFGAWLARNYGGAELLRRIVQCPQTDESAVINAVEQYTGSKTESLAGLLERWAAAVLLSDATTAPSGYRLNTGTWFTSSLGGESFSLGSIDFFNYTPTLAVYTSSSAIPAVSNHSSNLYFQAAKGLTGTRTWKITVPTGVLMNVVIR